MLSVHAALSFTLPPRAPSPRTVFAADVSGLTRFIITRCGLMVLLLGAVAMLLLENATALLVEDFIFLRAGSEGSFGGSAWKYFRRYFGGPRQYSRRILEELARKYKLLER